MAASGTGQADQFEKLVSKSKLKLHLSSGLWPRYLRGDVMPQGSLEGNKSCLVLRLDQIYPDTSAIFYHPTWELIDFERMLGPRQLRQFYLSMDESVWKRFVLCETDENGRPIDRITPFWKIDHSAADLQNSWSRIAGFDGLAVRLIEARMGYFLQDQVKFITALMSASSHLAKMSQGQAYSFQKHLSVLLILEHMCLCLAENLLDENLVSTTGNDQLMLYVRNRRNDWTHRNKAHRDALAKPAETLFVKWVNRLAYGEYYWW